MGPLTFLQHWYASHCNGEWEHGSSIKITSIDNPGWMLTVNLEDTELAGRIVDWVRQDESPEIWVHYKSDGRHFTAACGPEELHRALAAFEQFAQKFGHV